MYREQTFTENYYGIEYYLYVTNVGFSNFIDGTKKGGGAQAIAAKNNFQEELFNLELSGKVLPNHTRSFTSPPAVRCQYTSKEIKFYDYEN